MKSLMPAIRIKIFFTLVLGLLYPLVITGVAHLFFPQKASGEFVSRGGQIVGAVSIAQKFEKPQYFWSRPSAVDYNPLPSGGSNLGQASADLKKAVDDRRAKLKAANPSEQGEPPQDLLFASGSGLDPDITPTAAAYQLQRVAAARSMNVQDVQNLIAQSSHPRQLGILGEPTVNVLALNMALDHAQGIETAPVAAPLPPATPAPAETK